MYKLTPSVYCINHSYLNTMQQGIQAAHALSELFIMAQRTSDEHIDLMLDWGINHKTLKILNGGSGELFKNNLDRGIALAIKYKMPVARFEEADISGITTSFAFLLHPKVIKDLEVQREMFISRGFTTDDYLDSNDLIKFLKDLVPAK